MDRPLVANSSSGRVQKPRRKMRRKKRDEDPTERCGSDRSDDCGWEEFVFSVFERLLCLAKFAQVNY
jgi:hypothetical protein